MAIPLTGIAQRIPDLLRAYLAHDGYWAVGVLLLLENAGLPLPGETILLLASFLAYSQRELHLPYVILVGIAAATLGDNVGYAIGHHGGRPLLERYQRFFHLSARRLQRGERVFARYGSLTIFFARFVFGMRVIAGPLAGALRMEWRKFAIFNLLGACVWVSVIALAGYFFGQHWEALTRTFQRFDYAFAGLVILVIVLVWRRNRGKEDPN